MTAAPSDSHIGLVVEGEGDRRAVPVVLRSWLATQGIHEDILGKPVTCNGRDKAIMPKGLEGFAAVATSRPGCRGLLVVLDSEGDSVCQLGPELWKRAKSVTPLPVSVCLAEENYEDWIVASAETLQLGIEHKTTGGLAAIKKALRPQTYAKPTWQPRLSARMDLRLASNRSASFARLLAQLERLVALM